MDIKKLKELVTPNLGSGKEFISYNCQTLLDRGENYGSVMLALHIKIKNENNEEEIIECVAKTVPPGKGSWDLFNIPLSFKKEVAQYTTVAPIFDKFGREKGIDGLMHFFARCLGGRISMNSITDVADDDAVLILENLIAQNYSVGDRYTGFDLETTKLILNNLAELHAAPIAFKLSKPEDFESKIRPHLNKSMVFEVTDSVFDNMLARTKKQILQNPQCMLLLPKIEKGMRKMKDIFTYPKIREPFATFMHNDLWANNILVKYEEGKPIHNVFVDLAICEYNSPARDVLFFLYSSVKLEVIENKIDELIKYYYHKLIDSLKRLECDVSIFSFELFMEEINIIAEEVEFAHIMFMFSPIFKLKTHAVDLKDFEVGKSVHNEKSMHENYYKRLCFVIQDFAKRNWI